MLGPDEGDTPGAPAGDAAALDASDAVPRAPLAARRLTDRLASLLQVIVCSGVTQFFVAAVLIELGVAAVLPDGSWSLGFVAGMTMLDTALLVTLVVLFLRARGERPRDVFFAHRSAAREIVLGVLLVPVVFVCVAAVALTVERFAPWLHNVPDNPLAALLRSMVDRIVMVVVVIVGGGVREELQRAFVLHRFEQHLGGGLVGLFVFNALFGLGHAIQGWDVTIITGTLGLLWGAVWLRRRSIVAPMVSHALFNVIEVVQFSLTT